MRVTTFDPGISKLPVAPRISGNGSVRPLMLDVAVDPRKQPVGDLQTVLVLHQHVRVAVKAHVRQRDEFRPARHLEVS